MYKMVSLQTNASKVALAGLLAASLCGGSMMVGASTAYAGEVTISNTADANALSYNAFKLFNATKNDDGSVSSITWGVCKIVCVSPLKGQRLRRRSSPAQGAGHATMAAAWPAADWRRP